MKTVFLLRHAKSDWDEPGLDDYERPLAPRGVVAAKAMGRHMARVGLIPGHVLCSGARRARESWELVASALDPDIPVEILPAIYHGSSDTLRDLIRSLPAPAESVLLVGHNPTLHHLALTFSSSGDSEALQHLHEKYPTGALAILDFDVPSWNRISAGAGCLRDFVRPKALREM